MPNSVKEKEVEVQLKEDKKTMFNNVVNTIIATTLVGILTTNVVMYREQAVMQYQLSEIGKAGTTYLTRQEADSRAKVRDVEFSSIVQKQSELDTRLSRIEGVVR